MLHGFKYSTIMTTNSNKNNYCKGIVLIISTMLLVSCFEKYHNMDLPDYEAKLVVSSFFNASEPFKVNVAYSQSRANTQKFLPVSNANVQLYEDGIWVEELVGAKNNYNYFTDSVARWFYYSEKTIPQSGRKYRIEVSVPGFETVSAESSIPDPVKISIIDTVVAFENYAYTMYTNVRMENPERKQWFFLAAANLNPVFGSNGTSSSKVIGYNKLYFRFNVKDPILGVRKNSSFEDYLIFSNDLISGEQYQFTIGLPMSGSMNTSNVSIELITLSDEAHAYLKSATDLKNNEPLYSEPVKVYTNVVGGLGVFAGIYISSDTIKNISYPNTIYK